MLGIVVQSSLTQNNNGKEIKMIYDFLIDSIYVNLMNMPLELEKVPKGFDQIRLIKEELQGMNENKSSF
jgi:hypothetical protein